MWDTKIDNPIFLRPDVPKVSARDDLIIENTFMYTARPHSNTEQLPSAPMIRYERTGGEKRNCVDNLT